MGTSEEGPSEAQSTKRYCNDYFLLMASLDHPLYERFFPIIVFFSTYFQRSIKPRLLKSV